MKVYFRRLKRIIVFFLAIGLIYFLSAPFIIPQVIEPNVHSGLGRVIYKPILQSIRKDWFGRGFIDWYFYHVCKMPLMIPREPSASWQFDRKTR